MKVKASIGSKNSLMDKDIDPASLFIDEILPFPMARGHSSLLAIFSVHFLNLGLHEEESLTMEGGGQILA